ncbi:MAG: four helix bundle protein [Verrucomicrobiota bacterium]
MTNDEGQMTKEARMIKYSEPVRQSGEDAFWGLEQNSHLLHEDGPVEKRVYDLEERTALFGEAIIRFAKKIPQNPVNNRLIDQLVGAGTSIGANYCEADDAVSKKEFKNKIGTCKKESRETKYFLRMVAVAEEHLKPEARVLWQEAKELHLIFSAIWRK